jgi:membrane-associated phospholipid phosphatase
MKPMKINYLVPTGLDHVGAKVRPTHLAHQRRWSGSLTAPLAVLGLAVTFGTANTALAVTPGNTVEQWNKIAEDTVVGSGAFQPEGLIYMSYVSAAVYNATVAIDRQYAPLGHPITAATGSSTEAAVIEAAYDTLVHYFPLQTGTLNSPYTAALALIPNGIAKSNGQAVGLAAATSLIAMRAGDGRLTPINTTSPFAAKTPAPGVWRLTPPIYAAAQTPWVGDVKPYVLESADQFLPDAPPDLQSDEWTAAFQYLRAYGAVNSSVRTPEQTAIALFWTANVVRQFNRIVRDVADAHGLDLAATARLAAMVDVTVADTAISMMHAKYLYLFWRPVTAIDPTSVKPTGDGFGPVPGYDDGNPATVEQPGWRPLIVTPNHPEYPSAHASITAALAEVLSRFLGTQAINIDVHGFDATGAAGNLNAVQHFTMAQDMVGQVMKAREWGGLHYPFSVVAGKRLGRDVAKYDLRHAFRPIDETDE